MWTNYEYREHGYIHKYQEHQKYIQGKQKTNNSGCFLCNECGKKFTSRQTYLVHLKAHKSTVEDRTCPVCNHVAQTVDDLERRHKKLHMDPTLPCPDCDKLFHTEMNLGRHRLVHHKPETSKKYFCGECQKGFHLKDSYVGHVNMHAGIKPFKCHYCNMCYQNNPNRCAHERKNHNEEYKSCILFKSAAEEE